MSQLPDTPRHYIAKKWQYKVATPPLIIIEFYTIEAEEEKEMQNEENPSKFNYYRECIKSFGFSRMLYNFCGNLALYQKNALKISL